MGSAMPVSGPLDFMPLWLLFAGTLVLTLLSAGLGFWLGGRKRRHSEEALKAPLGETVAAMLGLLALLLAFTFSLAASRFDARRGLVVEEANAIGTTWLRAGFLPEPERTDIRKLLGEYLEVRLSAVQSRQISLEMARSEELQTRLWAETLELGRKEPGSIMVGLFVNSLNEVIDLHAKRVMVGLRSRIQATIWAALYFVTLLAVGTMGYHAGLSGARRVFAILSPVLAFSVVLLLIADLDRPQAGLFKTSQQALADLRNLMKGT